MTRTAYTTLGWVVLFAAFHIYWYLGGVFASPGTLPGEPQSLASWVFDVLTTIAFPLGAWVCLAIARGWARGPVLTSIAATLVWTGCALLLVRGGAGITDDLTRATGLLRDGITGLSAKDATGHAHLRWTDWTIDAYFLAGGIIFALLAARYRARRAHPRGRSTARHLGHVPPSDPLRECSQHAPARSYE